MDTENKLVLSARPGKLALIREGMFLRCYQQSLFSLVLSVYPEIKITGRRIKKLNGQVVYYGGFPVSGLGRIFPGARQTDWGAEVDCDIIDKHVYQEWLAGLPSPEDVVANRLPLKKNVRHQYSLNEEASRFLDCWEPGAFPASVDAGFILGLKQLRARHEREE